MYELRLFPQVADDLKALPRPSLQAIAVDLIRRIRDGVDTGMALEARPGIGDLSDCRKLYFDDRPGEVGFRVVFRYLPSDDVIEVVEVVAVGPRGNLAVYLEAVTRLGRK